MQILAQPVVPKGAAIAIRIFSQALAKSAAPEYLYGKPVSLVEIRREKMKAVTALLKTDLAAALEMIVWRKLNVLVSGGTSSGKTTVARHLLSFIGEDERIVTIEDALELFPRQQNVVAMLADRKSDSPRNPARLLEAALRLRPDRIVLGEIRGSEALTYIEAINTGHGGSVSTIHAETAGTAIDRLAMMVLQAGTVLNFGEVKEYIAQTIDVIIQLGRENGRRGVTEIVFPASCLEHRNRLA
ncbi:CpaF/VirB11 family protein [Cypionkella psychrotolerans]